MFERVISMHGSVIIQSFDKPVSAGAKSPPLEFLPGGKNSFALLIVYAKSTAMLSSVSKVAIP
jgi:hypothetical protein